MRIAVLGPPGAERGTVAGLVAGRLGVPPVRLADAYAAGLRHGTPAATEAKRHMDSGRLVPDEVVLAIVREHLAGLAGAGFVLDGLPRGPVRAGPLDALLADLGAPLDRVVDLVLSDAEVVRRLGGRRTCRGCDARWHVEFDPPSRPGRCDRCGSGLFQRDNDQPERVHIGLESYRPMAEPVLDHYRSRGTLLSVDATLPVEEIAARATA
ncbi:nucleoside monophosphate kinase [Micromonospora sp. NPDC049559]|uniref:adenylate kinase family protein n=1 Tax=Micromonospora sp. NPDC049559 TaxID=3155923 RepID=UPI0034457FA2